MYHTFEKMLLVMFAMYLQLQLVNAGWQLNCGDKAIILDYDVIYKWQALPRMDPRIALVTPCNVTVADDDRVVLFGTPDSIPNGALVPGYQRWTADHRRSVTVPCPENGVYLEEADPSTAADVKCKRSNAVPRLQARSCQLDSMSDYVLLDGGAGGSSSGTGKRNGKDGKTGGGGGGGGGDGRIQIDDRM